MLCYAEIRYCRLIVLKTDDTALSSLCIVLSYFIPHNSISNLRFRSGESLLYFISFQVRKQNPLIMFSVIWAEWNNNEAWRNNDSYFYLMLNPTKNSLLYDKLIDHNAFNHMVCYAHTYEARWAVTSKRNILFIWQIFQE